jgi:hypothetical protein
MLTNHILLRITTSARIYTALDNQSHSAPFADQSELTAATTSLGSAHLDLYKGHSSQPAIISDHISQSAITSTQWSNQLLTTPTQPLQLSSNHTLRPGNSSNRAVGSCSYRHTQRHIMAQNGCNDSVYIEGVKSASALAVAQWSFSGPASFPHSFTAILYISYMQFNIYNCYSSKWLSFRTMTIPHWLAYVMVKSELYSSAV